MVRKWDFTYMHQKCVYIASWYLSIFHLFCCTAAEIAQKSYVHRKTKMEGLLWRSISTSEPRDIPTRYMWTFIDRFICSTDLTCWPFLSFYREFALDEHIHKCIGKNRIIRRPSFKSHQFINDHERNAERLSSVLQSYKYISFCFNAKKFNSGTLSYWTTWAQSGELNLWVKRNVQSYNLEHRLRQSNHIRWIIKLNLYIKMSHEYSYCFFLIVRRGYPTRYMGVHKCTREYRTLTKYILNAAYISISIFKICFELVYVQNSEAFRQKSNFHDYQQTIKQYSLKWNQEKVFLFL